MAGIGFNAGIGAMARAGEKLGVQHRFVRSVRHTDLREEKVSERAGLFEVTTLCTYACTCTSFAKPGVWYSNDQIPAEYFDRESFTVVMIRLTNGRCPFSMYYV